MIYEQKDHWSTLPVEDVHFSCLKSVFKPISPSPGLPAAFAHSVHDRWGIFRAGFPKGRQVFALLFGIILFLSAVAF